MMPVMGAVCVAVMLHGFLGVMHGMQVMAVSRVRVVRRLFVMAGIVMLGRFVVVLSRRLVVFGRLAVMICAMMCG